MQLKWTDLADTDLETIETYISKENSLAVAVDVVLTIIGTAQLILTDHPKAGRQGRVSNTRELIINRLPFIVIYRENSSSNTIEILRVLHDTQQWPTASQ